MKRTTALLPLFKQFIRESETGKRLKKNGEKITKNSIDNYRYVYNNLIRFCLETDFDLRICHANRLNTREQTSEKNYWKNSIKNTPTFCINEAVMITMWEPT